MWSVENSLKRLQTDYIDLLQVHTWDSDTPLRETWSTMSELVKSGKVRYLGVSNHCGYQLQQVVDLTKQLGLEPIICLQPQYNLLCRFIEWDLTKVCSNEGIAMIPWSPLAGGWLAGKVKKGGANTDTRVAWAQKIGWKHTGFDFHNNERTWGTLDAVEQVAKAIGKSMAQVSLRWLIQKPGVTAPIIGAKTLEQLKDNMDVIGWKLSDDDMKKLDEASFIAPPYPWGEAWNTGRRPPI